MKENQTITSKIFNDTGKSHFRTIFVLFIVLRLSILLLYTPQGVFNAYTDYHYYFQNAEFSEQGRYPFINMWTEYPPIATYAYIGAYRIARLTIPSLAIDNIGYLVYSKILGTMLLVFETGTLLFLFRISRIIWGTEKANWVAWVYSSLSLPLFFWNVNHNSILVFFLLLSIDLFLTRKWYSSSATLGLAIASKYTAVFLLGSTIKFLWHQNRRKIIQYAIIAPLTTVMIFIPFILLGGWDWIVASFKSLAYVASWETIWAMIDGNWAEGTVGLLPTRIQLDKAGIINGNPSTIPELLKTAIFAVIYARFFFRPIKKLNPKTFIWFTTLTAMLFNLWSKGWSPQWGLMLIPLFLLSFPNKKGIALVISLTCSVFLQWPISRALHSNFLLSIAIISRTLILIYVAVLTTQNIWKPPLPDTYVTSTPPEQLG
jgi:hypothetical protein